MSTRYSDENPFEGRRPSQSQPPQYLSQNAPPVNPAAHPDSAFNRLRAERGYGQQSSPQTYTAFNTGSSSTPPPPPPPPPHHSSYGSESGYSASRYTDSTPGADNFGMQAGGGLTGIAMSVAGANARESGIEAMRNTPGYEREMLMPHYQEPSPYERPEPRQEMSSSSLTPLGAAAFPPGMATPQSRSTISRSTGSAHQELYVETPYRYSRNIDPALAEFDPNAIEDDGDDGLEYRNGNRVSMLSLAHNSDRTGPALAAGGAAAAGGIMGSLGSLVGRNGKRAAPQYNPVNAYGANEYNLGEGQEKSEWLSKQSTGNKRLRWAVGILVVLAIVGAIAGGVVGGILGKKNSNNSSNSPQGQSAQSDTSTNGDLNKNSAEIQKLLNNKNLHKVFPGIDYTPMYTQYPDCLTYPPSQNNVTRDLAVLSQLTNTVRLYGTDCNQTEMVLHSIDQLGLNGTMKIWMGVWQDTNTTTNARQLEQMYNIFNTHGSASFVGVIVGNEVLFRKDMTITELGTLITGVKANLTSQGITLPVASSDLGDNWTAEFANQVDYVMANIHPFFAGVDSNEAASWTYDFWTSHDTLLKSNDLSKNIISETGWPSQGGTDCGGATNCTGGSVAGITEMNNFMNDWVCQSLANGTNYFWFEAFDEPWKIQFDTPGMDWEDQWGLMDVNRNLKPGVVIPSCGGTTVT